MSNKTKHFDFSIIGAGIYGLHVAVLLAQKGFQVALIEKEDDFFKRASFVNQGRLHNGYHYPRSRETAYVAARNYRRFRDDFSFALNDSFEKIYAISAEFSKVNVEEYREICRNIGIPLEELPTDIFFNPGMVESAFKVEEAGFDWLAIKNFYKAKISSFENIKLYIQNSPKVIIWSNDHYNIELMSNEQITATKIVNTTYANINKLIGLVGDPEFKIKYELCEVALCETSKNLQNHGITVMDGPFFSVMPFGDGRQHSLTAVSHTPVATSYQSKPSFRYKNITSQNINVNLEDVYIPKNEPKSNWDKMYELFRLYMKSTYDVKHTTSLFTVRPVLLASEGDDARPAIIKRTERNPNFITIFSGKISGIYELEKYIDKF